MKISRDGFKTKTIDLSVTPDSTASLTAVLEALNPGSAQVLFSKSNQKLITTIESFNGGIFNDQSNRFSNVDYKTCQSLRYPDSKDVKALCLEGIRDQDYQSVLLKVPQRRYVEILYGSPSQYNVYEDGDINVQYVSTYDTDKPTLYIKVINDQLIMQPKDQILTVINKSLSDHSYDTDNYYFIYGDLKLDDELTVPEKYHDEEDYSHAPHVIPGVTQ